MAQGARDPRLRGARRLRRVRAARRAGPAVDRAPRPPRRAAVHASRWARSTAIEVMVNRTGYTGEVGCELMCPAEDAAALWDAVVARGRRPCGLGARDTLRLEVCYPLHGNDITPDDGRDLGRARLDVRARQGLHRRRGAAADQGGGAEAEARRLRDGREGRAARRHADRRRRRGDVRHALADARPRDRAGLRPGRGRAAPGPSSTIDVRGNDRRATVVPKPIYKPGGLTAMAAAESYPEELKYHPEHDWARDRGRRGGARDHVVRPGRARRARPLRGARGRRDRDEGLRPTARSSRSRPSPT